MERKQTAAVERGGATSGGTDWADRPQQPAAAQQSRDSFLGPALPLPSEWASLEVAAPPPSLTPPGQAGTQRPAWVGGGRRLGWDSGRHSPLRAAGDRFYRVPAIKPRSSGLSMD